MDGELVGAREEDGDAGKEGEEEVLHVDPLQLKPHMFTPLQKNRWVDIPNMWWYNIALFDVLMWNTTFL